MCTPAACFAHNTSRAFGSISNLCTCCMHCSQIARGNGQSDPAKVVGEVVDEAVFVDVEFGCDV
jgi:hypothetical protein